MCRHANRGVETTQFLGLWGLVCAHDHVHLIYIQHNVWSVFFLPKGFQMHFTVKIDVFVNEPCRN